MVRNVKDALLVKSPSLGQLCKQYGDKQAQAYIKVWLINLNASLNLKRPLEEHHIDECSFLIVSEYKNISIADINLIFRNAKLGKYGELYESLSIDKVLRWFYKYFDKRCNTAAMISRQEAEKFKYEDAKHPRSAGKEAQKMKDAIHQYNLEKLMKQAEDEKTE